MVTSLLLIAFSLNPDGHWQVSSIQHLNGVGFGIQEYCEERAAVFIREGLQAVCVTEDEISI